MKEYNYINDLGCPKKLVVRPLNGKGEYTTTIWNILNGECCGIGQATAKELNEFLAHYGYSKQFEES